ncbi:hypothetical protein RND71_010394 [Anisodus tanguticus]|uniref:Uncharacterized protein n=1 Tax=Anisodus tanguticus TaxID=243964 RepID=A0AAE1SHP1_9SOLA|nr:hypothetical protein RND71_010394 [Anisodus tanguticus]
MEKRSGYGLGPKQGSRNRTWRPFYSLDLIWLGKRKGGQYCSFDSVRSQLSGWTANGLPWMCFLQHTRNKNFILSLKKKDIKTYVPLIALQLTKDWLKYHGPQPTTSQRIFKRFLIISEFISEGESKKGSSVSQNVRDDSICLAHIENSKEVILEARLEVLQKNQKYRNTSKNLILEFYSYLITLLTFHVLDSLEKIFARQEPKNPTFRKSKDTNRFQKMIGMTFKTSNFCHYLPHIYKVKSPLSTRKGSQVGVAVERVTARSRVRSPA